MSEVMYRVTKDVRHLSVWTSDAPGDTRGRYRPICGAIIKGRLTMDSAYESPAALAFAMRRPICKRCSRQAADLATEAGVL